MLVEVVRVYHSKLDVAALAANVRFDFPVESILEDQGVKVPDDDGLQDAI